MVIRPAQFVTVYDEFARRAVESFNETGKLPPMLFGVTMDRRADLYIHVVSQMDPKMVLSMHTTQAGKEALDAFASELLDHDSELCRMMASQGAPLPDLVVHVSEAFMARRTEGSPVPLSELDDRQECIYLALSSAEQTLVGFCPIEENPRRCKYGAIDVFAQVDVHVRMSKPVDDSPDKSRLH